MLTYIYETMGIVGLILLSFSIIIVSLFIAKLYQFWKMRLWRSNITNVVMPYINNNQLDKIYQVISNHKHPVATILSEAIDYHKQGLSSVQIKQQMEQSEKQYLSKIESYFRTFDVIANLSPLLGLLGTVLGMITAFTQLEAAGMNVDPSLLSGGISLALLTTAAGISIAVPTLTALNYLESVAEKQQKLFTSITTKFMLVLEKA